MAQRLDALSPAPQTQVAQAAPSVQNESEPQMTRYEYAEAIYEALLNGTPVSEELINEFAPELEQIRQQRQH